MITRDQLNERKIKEKRRVYKIAGLKIHFLQDSFYPDTEFYE